MHVLGGCDARVGAGDVRAMTTVPSFFLYENEPISSLISASYGKPMKRSLDLVKVPMPKRQRISWNLSKLFSQVGGLQQREDGLWPELWWTIQQLHFQVRLLDQWTRGELQIMVANYVSDNSRFAGPMMVSVFPQGSVFGQLDGQKIEKSVFKNFHDFVNLCKTILSEQVPYFAMGSIYGLQKPLIIIDCHTYIPERLRLKMPPIQTWKYSL